jgi:hypothetical protein
MLPVAGFLYEPLISDSPIDQRLWHNLQEASAIYTWYWPNKFEPVDLRCTTELRPPSVGRLASFYSGGIDSLYNIAETQSRSDKGIGRQIDELWLVHGFDVGLEDSALWQQVRGRLVGDLGGCLSQQIVCVRTNLREFHPGDNFWPDLGFSSALAAVGKCVTSRVDEVLIGSYGTYAEAIPHASSPLIDPMWSCRRQSVVHFSCRVNRRQKMQVIGHVTPQLLRGLRVCYLNPEGEYNCGRCEKCLRTALQLALLGFEKECDTFDFPIDPDLLKSIRLPWRPESAYAWSFWEDLRRQCRETHGFERYADAVSAMMRRSRINLCRRPLRRIRNWYLELNSSF